MNNQSKFKILLVGGFILIAAVSRLLPHIYNFTPVAAMALFGGAYLNNKRLAFVTTFAAMFVSDLLVNAVLYNQTDVVAYFKEPFVWAVYGCFGVIVFMGTKLNNNVSAKRVAGFSISGSLLFWIITNFVCWPGNPLYTQDVAGLINCYVASIPFLGNIAGDLFYNGLLFGTFYLAQKRIPALVKK